MFYKLRNKWFETTFVLCETLCGHTSVKKVYKSDSGLYVVGMNCKLFLNKDNSFYGKVSYGGDPKAWTVWVGEPDDDEMEWHTLKLKED